MQEGLANVCLVGSSTTVQKAKIESSIPRKRGAAVAGYDKALQTFFNKVMHLLPCLPALKNRTTLNLLSMNVQQGQWHHKQVLMVAHTWVTPWW